MAEAQTQEAPAIEFSLDESYERMVFVRGELGPIKREVHLKRPTRPEMITQARTVIARAINDEFSVRCANCGKIRGEMWRIRRELKALLSRIDKLILSQD